MTHSLSVTREPDWRPDRTAALEQLRAFLPRAGSYYKRYRNTDPGPGERDGVSLLSPWLRHRLVLESEVVAATLEQHGFRSAEKFLQEVCWRTYFKGWLERRPAIWQRYRADVTAQRAALREQPDRLDHHEQAVAGRTGIDCFDAWAHELITTGYLHNHARMWFASIWIHTLGLPWALGADFFLRHLLDGDPASNTLSWRWVAGLHTPGKTYLARPDNIQRHTNGRFQPGPHELAAQAAPVGDADLPTPRTLPETDRIPDQAAILLHEDDLSGLGVLDPLPTGTGLAVLCAADTRSDQPTGSLARQFTHQACEQALTEAAERTQRQATRLLNAADSVEALVDWCREKGMDHVVTPWAPQGPVADVLAAAEPALRQAGIRLQQVRRDWDSLCWPHATRGFFGFWKPVSKMLRSGELRLASPWGTWHRGEG
ncbi:MAG: FAD-binding domain-containing protein [Ectothiorhodospiraceae bacterium]